MSGFHNTAFYTSVTNMRDLPLDTDIEVVFAGRSNAGKSSVINTLTNHNRLAYVSRTPGRTQQINFFQVREKQFLVDLPGYGYAKAPHAIKQQWQTLLSSYLQSRQSLKGLVLIMDIRHPLKPLDITMLNWFAPTGKAMHVLLTKADKLSKQQANITLNDVKNFLKNTYPECSVQLFSSLTPTGVEVASAIIGNWFGMKNN